jgi:hypothetical protein
MLKPETIQCTQWLTRMQLPIPKSPQELHESLSTTIRFFRYESSYHSVKTTVHTSTLHELMLMLYPCMHKHKLHCLNGLKFAQKICSWKLSKFIFTHLPSVLYHLFCKLCPSNYYINISYWCKIIVLPIQLHYSSDQDNISKARFVQRVLT